METRRYSLRIVVLIALTLAVGLAAYFGSRVSTPELPVAPVSKMRTERPAPESERMDDVAVADSPADNSANPETTSMAVEHSGPGIRGTWQLSLEVEGEVQPFDRFTFEQAGGQLAFTAEEGIAPGDATLDGMRLRFTYSMNKGRATYSFEGTVNAAYTHATGTLHAVFKRPDHPTEEETYDAELVLIPPEELRNEAEFRATREKRIREAQTIFKILSKFATRNGGEFPSTLAQLTPDDLGGVSVAEYAAGRRLMYQGTGKDTADFERIGEISRTMNAQPRTRDSLVELERQLREAWGSEVPSTGNLLRVQYDNPPMTIDISSAGELSINDSDYGSQDSEALREAEFNNLKQLGIVWRMFEAENDNFMPGGWLQVYPEYLADSNILHSPWAEPGTLSYDLIFPGYKKQELTALAQELLDAGEITENMPPGLDPESEQWRSRLASITPIITARDWLPAMPGYPPARAVGFLDGHVEAVSAQEWDTRIAPFLR